MSGKAISFEQFSKQYEGVASEAFDDGNLRLAADSDLPRYSKPELRRIGKYRKKADRKKVVAVRKSLVPGKVVILLTGKFAGRRCVYVKPLRDGFICVIGPYVVPLWAVDQREVQVTSTTVPLDGIAIPDDVTYNFLRAAVRSKRKLFYRDDLLSKRLVGEAPAPDPEAVARIQAANEKKKVYTADLAKKLIAKIVAVEFLKEYMETPFSLRDGQYPHKMRF